MNTLNRFALVAALICYGAAVSRAQSNTTVIEKVAGLRARLEIVKDREGVPHIRGRSEPDALFGLGFMHAQDRLWQLEFLRRLGQGRLSEVMGASTLEPDKLFRTLGIVQSASATWAHYSSRQRELVGSYVAGVNAAIDRQRKRGLPPEFQYLKFDPENWRGEDVLIVAKVMGWSVDTNWDQELVRLQLTQKLGSARTAQLMPAYTSDGPVIVPAPPGIAKRLAPSPALEIGDEVASALLALNRQTTAMTGFGGQGFGSNNQVLDATRTTTGGPILASDPHLPSQIPAIFYRVHLSGGALDVIGATVPGLPGVLMGHNGRLAWGWTNANADVQDFYIERIHEGRFAEYNGAREPLKFREEIVKVKGAADVHMTVRSTRHGPIVSDLVDPNGPALALRWAALDADDDIGISAYLAANRAQNSRDFADAFRRHKAHAQNLAFADKQGNIGYFLAGAVPVRTAGNGAAPVPGWTSEFEWKGYIPFREVPQSLNPEQGYLASSNNKIAPDSYPYTLSNSYAAPYRAARVLELLRVRSRHSMSDLEDLQADVTAIHARELLSLLPKSAGGMTDLQRRALEMLNKWDLRATPDSAAAAIFEAWYIQLAESVFADDLGEPLWGTYSEHLHMVSMALASALRENSAWCDDVRTPVRESCESIAMSALTLALNRMADAQGSTDLTSWQWGKVHRAVFFHQPFGADPALQPIFNRVVPNGGDKHTVNVASNPDWSSYDQRHVALYRQIIDLKDLAESRWMAAPGQSGLPSHPHYDDSIPAWQRVEYRPMLFTKQAIDNDATERLILQP